ncbi:YheU family protein [Agarivorans sp. MS3-6]|uniref:YheU family protein n=1 Tax=Agarivorans sp. TSD2052 TaxID=2937286 RepID=UPI00200BEA3C|nr:YheU family protein [Agarivorans sp. TSD2052]UPW19172.1 YheU family protein [Agarivorans sp. TSD2052]
MIIPWQQLEADTFNALLESYVLREGTDYGEQELSLADKLEQIKQQVINGSVLIVYSELHETVNLIAKEQFDASAMEGQQDDG